MTTKMEQSYITVDERGRPMAFIGPDATLLWSAMVLRQALRLRATTGMSITRSSTPTKELKRAGEFTGKRYKRGAYSEAAEDLTAWIDVMRAALPVTRRV